MHIKKEKYTYKDYLSWKEDEEIKNVVQPDITVMCDENKLDYRGARGTPDFIIEIVSPSSTFLDYVNLIIDLKKIF